MDDSVRCRPTSSEVRVRLMGHRSSDIIKSAGHKIGAAEIESVIPELAGVAEVAAPGKPTTISASGWWPGSRHDIPPMCYVVDTMSTSVGIRELRQQASAVLRRVVGGETIEVTGHGHPIARIVPLRPGIIDQMVLDGRATEARGDLIDLADQMGLPTDASGPVLPSVALAQLRSDER